MIFFMSSKISILVNQPIQVTSYRIRLTTLFYLNVLCFMCVLCVYILCLGYSSNI